MNSFKKINTTRPHNVKWSLRSLLQLLLFLFGTIFVFGQNPNSPTNFITIWTPHQSGNIYIPMDNSEEYNFDIYWENVNNTAINGSATNITEATLYQINDFDNIHAYKIEGVTIGEKYRIEISGNFPIFKTHYTVSATILEVSQWGSAMKWKNMVSAFNNCSRLDVTATDTPDLSDVNSLWKMFENCYELNGENANWNWNTSTITSMSSMFVNCNKFNGDISLWDVSNVSDMTQMFANSRFNRDISLWNVSNLIHAANMFSNSWYNHSLGNWKLTNLTNANSMFGESHMDCVNWSATLIGWADNVNDQNATINMGVGGLGNSNKLSYSADAADAITTLTTHGWTFTGNQVATGVNPTATTPGVISGVDAVCLGGTSTYSATEIGGQWKVTGVWEDVTDDPWNAISQNGVLTTGFTTDYFTGWAHWVIIKYVVGNECSSVAEKYVFVTLSATGYSSSGNPNSIVACVGTTTTLTPEIPGGTWTQILNSPPVPGYDIDLTAGTVTPHDTVVTSPYMGIITYTLPPNEQGCIDKTTVNISIVPPHTMGNISITNDKNTICIGDTPTLTYAGASTIDPGNFTIYTNKPWQSSDTTILKVDPNNGDITALKGGAVTVTYHIIGDMLLPIGQCFDTVRSIQIVVLPNNAGTIDGIDNLSVGLTTTYTSSAGEGGVWSSSNTDKAEVDPNTGVITAKAAGTVTITYTVSNDCGTDAATKDIELKDCNPLPNAGTISGLAQLEISNSTTYTSDGDTGGTWTSSLPNILNIHSTTGVGTGINEGTATITYTVTNACGTISATKEVKVSKAGEGGENPPAGINDIETISNVNLFPNPANNQINIELTMQNNADINILLVDLNGKILNNKMLSNVSTGTNNVVLDISNYANGIYSVIIRSEQSIKTTKLVINH